MTPICVQTESIDRLSIIESGLRQEAPTNEHPQKAAFYLA